jgi:general secretion pathway protein D
MRLPRPKLWVSAFVALALAACAAQQHQREGMSMIEKGQYAEGLRDLEMAADEAPRDASIRRDVLRQREILTYRYLTAGARATTDGRLEDATVAYLQVLQIDPNNATAKAAIANLQKRKQHASLIEEAQALAAKGDIAAAKTKLELVLLEDPANARAVELRSQYDRAATERNLNGQALALGARKPVTLQFRDANMRMVVEAISRVTGVNILVDKDVRNDLKVTIFVTNATVEEALDLILMQNQLSKRVLGPSSVIIYPNTPAKAKEYEELKVRRFALTHADAKQVQSMLKTVLRATDVFVDEKSNAILLRDSPQVIRLAEKLVASMDQAEPEVMLEIDVMEVNRDRMMELGVDLPTSFGASVTGLTLDELKNLSDKDVAVSDLSATARFGKTDADVNDLATPRIRVRNRQKAKFLIGDRLPVISTSAVPSTTLTTPVYNTNVQYVEVGIRMEAQPTIFPNGNVAIDLTLEVSSAGEPNAEAEKFGTIAYPIGTRTVTTILELKDGESEVIGGLITDQDRKSASKIPGLGDIPILGRLFGSQKDTWNKREIVFAITPHIIRNNTITDADLVELWAGTDTTIGSTPVVTAAPSGTRLPRYGAPAPTAAAPAEAAPVAAPPVTQAPEPQATPGTVAAPEAAVPEAPTTDFPIVPSSLPNRSR